jgi:hypothetical protein
MLDEVSPRPSFLVVAVLCALGAIGLLGTAGCSSERASAASSMLVRVPQDAQTLEQAAAKVSKGGTILLAPGHYSEQLEINTPDVTVRGEDRNGTVIDGGGIRPYAVVVIADGVRVENLTVTGATFYGVLFTGLHDANGPSAESAGNYQPWDTNKFPPLQRFLVDHVTAYNNGLYGIYSFDSRHGVISDSYASGSADSGIYVGQCTQCDILVSGNIAERNAVGFEDANASDSLVITGNRFSGNRVGLTLLSSYQEAFTPQRAVSVVGNLISNNDTADAPAQADGGFATGIGISGGVSNTIDRNRISGHQRAAVAMTNTEDLPAKGNSFSGNVFDNNRVDVANVSAARTPAVGNCSSDAATAAPVALLAQLRAACSAAATPRQAAQTALAGPEAPPGVSFKKVTPPPDQPNMPVAGSAISSGTNDAAEPLPASVSMPDLSAVTAPDADLLASSAGLK